jgi:8-oxo-dGTP pyrophosphatase MutT (NUDIX family)
MTAVDDLWYLATEARQEAEQVYHRIDERHEGYLEYGTTRSVSRSRFRTVAQRIERQGLPFGAHTLAYRPGGDLLLVKQAAIDQLVLPGGEVDPGETFREGARRELHEEAGVDADYEGIGVLGRVRFRCGDHETWGVLPIFEGEVTDGEPDVRDPDGEVTEARWFAELPENTRDREILREWRERKFGD